MIDQVEVVDPLPHAGDGFVKWVGPIRGDLSVGFGFTPRQWRRKPGYFPPKQAWSMIIISWWIGPFGWIVLRKAKSQEPSGA